MFNFRKLFSLIIIVFFILDAGILYAGTTGKITGKVIDSQTKEPMIGANVLLRGTTLGAATDVNGDYVILNIPPGIYEVEISYIGYQPVITQNVKVSIDKTTKINIEIRSESLELGEVVVTAERPMIKTDLTSTEAVVGSDKIAVLPVESFDEIVNLQAGVTNGHFRGGRQAEVAYLIDGIPVNDVYSGSYALEVDNASISEVQVISGTFNAEYGQAMSGVVNIVTKDGGEKYEGEVETYFGTYYSKNNNVFKNLDTFNPISNFQANLSGPVPYTNNKMNFFFAGRVFDSDGYIFGKHVFDPSDQSDFSKGDTQDWIIQSRGQTYNFTEETAKRVIDEAEYVSLNSSRRYTSELKLTYKFNNNYKISYNGLFQKSDWIGGGKAPNAPNEPFLAIDFDHRFRLNPDGDYKRRQTGFNNSFIWSQILNSRTFFTIKYANFYNKYRQYVYEDFNDPKYVSVIRLLDSGANAFYSGGQQMWHFERSTNTNILIFDYTSQVTMEHQVKFGVEGKRHTLKLHEFEILTEGSTRIPPLSSYNNNQYTRNPVEGAVYIQDKMEFEDIIVNAGIRYDYFNPKADIPTDFQNPGSSNVIAAESSSQLSPRFGIAYPVSVNGVIHVSYGHFFQIPSYAYLYLNPEFDILPLQSVPSPPPASMLNTVGNAGLKPQQTVIYELGLQQQLTDDFGLTLTTFYKDIRNLLGTEVHYTLQGIKYGRYINRDYGNVKGITVAFEKRHTNNFSATLDYTYQVAKGNASDPNTAFLDQATDPPKQTVKQLVSLSWDRTHQVNLTLTYGDIGNYVVSMIGRLGTGMPYTPTFQNIQTAVENSTRKPVEATVDLFAYKNLTFGGLQYQFYFRAYNILDRLNELDVFADTGRAGYSLAPLYVGGLRPRGVNTLDEYYIRPDYYSEPRKIQMGIKIKF